MERRPEPELMEASEQARAYAAADFSRTDQALVDRILTLLTSSAQPQRLVDLGCGPGNISFRLAEALPETFVLGLDGAAAMLEPALERQRAEPTRWPSLRFHRVCLPVPDGGLTELPCPFQPPYPLLVSNSLLHHLHQPQVLWSSLRRLGAPGSLVMVRDLRRPETPDQLEELVHRHARGCPPVLKRDYRASLEAAFQPDEVEHQLREAGLSSLQVEALEDRYLEVSGLLP